MTVRRILLEEGQSWSNDSEKIIADDCCILVFATDLFLFRILILCFDYRVGSLSDNQSLLVVEYCL